MKALTLIFVLLLSSSLNILSAQETNPDSLLIEVRKYTEQKKYDTAISLIKTLITIYPENLDYSIFLARLYFWSNSYDLAQKQTNTILAENPINEEAYNLLAKIELADKKYAELLLHSENGIVLFPKENDFYTFYKAQALEKLGRDDDALLILDEIQKTSEFYNDAQYVKTQVLKKQKNAISIGYLNTSFSNPGDSPWHFGMLEYLKKTHKGAYLGRITYGYLYGISALQAEADAYPRISKNAYLFLNGGFSDGKSLFPLFRMGAELYQDYKRYNFSLGSRYLNFTDSKVLMFTGHVAVNFNEWKLAYRSFLVNQSKEWFPSHILNLRKSFENKEAYVQLDLQYGGMPYYFFITNEFSRINAIRTGIDTRLRIKDNYFIQTTFMYELEETIPDEFRNRYNAQLTVSKRF